MNSKLKNKLIEALTELLNTQSNHTKSLKIIIKNLKKSTISIAANEYLSIINFSLLLCELMPELFDYKNSHNEALRKLCIYCLQQLQLDTNSQSLFKKN